MIQSFLMLEIIIAVIIVSQNHLKTLLLLPLLQWKFSYPQGLTYMLLKG